MRYFFFFFLTLLCACGPGTDTEFQNLKAELFRPVEDMSELPIYADPPTGDWEDVREGVFNFQLDSTELTLLNKYRKELEPLVLQYLDSATAWVYLAAYLRYESAVPALKQALLECDDFYGWEGGDYTSLDRYLDDEQYCYQMAYIAAIEYITQKPISSAISLSKEESDQLSALAAQCQVSDTLDESTCAALWLLEKISGKKPLKRMLQGLWEDKPGGAAYFLIDADSIIYPHHDLSPNRYSLSGDTIIEKDGITQKTYKYVVLRVTEDSLVLNELRNKSILRLARR